MDLTSSSDTNLSGDSKNDTNSSFNSTLSSLSSIARLK